VPRAHDPMTTSDPQDTPPARQADPGTAPPTGGHGSGWKVPLSAEAAGGIALVVAAVVALVWAQQPRRIVLRGLLGVRALPRCR
jgi:hypothetical protein